MNRNTDNIGTTSTTNKSTNFTQSTTQKLSSTKIPRTTVISGTGLKIMKTSLLSNWLRRARVDIEVMKEFSTGGTVEELMSSFYGTEFKRKLRHSKYDTLMSQIEPAEREPLQLHVSEEIAERFIAYNNPSKDCFIIIDFRDEADFEKQHIYGSFNIDNKKLKQGIDAISRDIVKVLNEQSALVVCVSDSTSLVVENTLSLRSKIIKFEKANFVVLNQTVSYFATQYPNLMVRCS